MVELSLAIYCYAPSIFSCRSDHLHEVSSFDFALSLLVDLLPILE